MAVEQAWHTEALGKVVTLQRGFDLPTRMRRSGGVPVVSSAGITDFHDKAMVHPPGVVTGRYGTIGELFFLSEAFWPLNTTLYVRDFHGNEPRYVYYLLQRFDFNAYSGKSGVPGVNRNDLHRESVILPNNTEEQRAIARVLEDVDDLLSALSRLITKKRELKLATMQELLTGRRRLPGFTASWTAKQLGDVGKFAKGRGIRKDDVLDDGIPCIRYGEIYTHHSDYVRTFYSFISPRVAKDSYRLKKGDLLFAGSGETAEEIGKCVAFLGDDEVYAGGDIVVLSPHDHDSLFLGYLMNHTSVVQQKARMGQGDAVVHISASHLAQITVTLPDSDEQAAIAAVLRDMDTEISTIDQRLAKTRGLKQGMMQELLTGKTRLV